MSVVTRLRRFFDGSMRANAVALVAHQLASALLGFVYWLLAARLYPVETVGMSSAVISTIQLVSGLAQFGLVSGMQRFIPRAGRHARRLALSSYAVVTVSAAIAGVVALFAAAVIAPGQGVFGSIPPAYVVLAAVAWTLFYLQDGVLVGLREAVWVFAENFAYNFTKIVLLVAGAGALRETGIVASWFVPAPVAVALVSVLIFGKLLRPERLRDHADPSEHVTAREIVASISGDHVGALVAEAALRILPLLVVRLAGVEANAYFYQAWMISTVLGLVASGMANSFTADTAADRRRVAPNSRAILRTMGLLLLPAALAIGLGAPLVLRVFGEAYALEGAGLLRVLALAVAPVIVNTWYVAYLRVMGRIRKLIWVRVVSSAVLVGVAYIGLQSTGILGVGIGWLVSQFGMAAYAVYDTHAVLASRSAREQRGRGASMRRGDWRFLLPVPHPEVTAVFAEGPLAESARMLGGRVVDGDSPDARECDLCVLDRPGPEELRRGYESLRSCGSCYAEWPHPRPGGPSAVAAQLRRAGFDEPVMYWPAPWLGKARLWVRVPTPGEGYRRVLGELLERSTPGSYAGKALSRFAALALRLGFVPSLVTIARKPCSGDTPCRSDDFCDWLERTLCDATGEGAGLMIMMRTGGSSDENKVNWLVYEDRGARLRWIAKAPRHPVSLPALEREHEALVALERHASGSALIKTPRAVLRTTEPGFPLFVQTAIQGMPLLRFALAEGYPAAARQLSDALADLADPAERLSPSEWWPNLVEPWLERLGRQLQGIGDPAVAHRARRALEGFGELPMGWTHNDCTPWNTVVTDRGLGIFDWETADERGLPAVDLVYALATTAFSLDGTEGTARSIDSYRRLMDGSDERGAAFAEALDRYRTAVGLGEQDLSRLRVMTWLLHATHDLHNLLTATDAPSSDLLGECVCLPMLNAELDRHLASYLTDQDAPVAEVLFVSPHLDDAVLSCGAAMHRLARQGADVTVVTVFTADAPDGSSLSALARTCHEVWGSDAPFGPRRREDLDATARLGARARHLGFLDAVYRVDSAGRPLYDASQRTAVSQADDAACLEPLQQALAEVLAERPHATVFCPSGIGGHVDHALVRRAIERAAPARLVFYDEYPYLVWTADAHEPERAPSASYAVLPDAEELAASIAASACYLTQVPGLFPSTLGRAARIARERMPRAFAWLPIRTGSPEQALRRMEARLRRDKQRYGERYRWADTSWSGPFDRT